VGGHNIMWVEIGGENPISPDYNNDLSNIEQMRGCALGWGVGLGGWPGCFVAWDNLWRAGGSVVGVCSVRT